MKKTIETSGPARRAISTGSTQQPFTSGQAPFIHDTGLSAAARTKILAMSERIQALEDGLQAEFIGHETHGDMEIGSETRAEGNSAAARSLKNVHPLLVPNLLAIKDIRTIVPNEEREEDVDREGREGGRESVTADEAAEEMMAAFGTLSMRDGKDVRFLGPSAAEVCLSLSELLIMVNC